MPYARPSLRPVRRIAAVLALSLFALLVTGAAPARAQIPYRGVMLHSLWSGESNAQMAKDLDMAQDLGSNVVRVDLAWSSLETNGRGQYSSWYVQKLDAFVSGAAARGMKVLPNIYSTPCWASSAPSSLKQNCAGSWWDRDVTIYMPANLSDYANIVSWVVGRYGTKLAAVEIWNEPNGSDRNFLQASDLPGAYTSLVKAAYPAAKAANPSVPVLAGALSYADAGFLQSLYNDGIKGYYDGISVHPYNEWRAPGDMWKDQYKKYTLIPGLKWIHQTQLGNGDNTPVWATEFGWTSCSIGADKICVTPSQQAQYVHDSFPLIDQLGYVRSAIVYNLVDKGSDASSSEDNFGLVNPDYSLKPAYSSLKSALSASTAPVEDPPPPVQDPAPPSDPTPPVGDPTPPSDPSNPPTGTPPPVTTVPAPAPSPAPKPTSGGRHHKQPHRLSVRVVRQRARVAVAGTATAHHVRVDVYTKKRGVRRHALRRWVTVRSDGTFRTVLPRSMNGAHLLVRASAAGLADSARVR
jgi:hypothetical protein